MIKLNSPFIIALVLFTLLSFSKSQLNSNYFYNSMNMEIRAFTISPASHFAFLKVASTLSPLSRQEKIQIKEEMSN